MKHFICLFIIPVFLFCNFLQEKDLNVSNKKQYVQKTGSQIVYLFFKVEKNGSGIEKIILQGKKITEGKLKTVPHFDQSLLKAGDFIVSLNDVNGKKISEQIVDDPLHPTMEVYQDGISRNELSLESAEFSVRYSQAESINIVTIEKATNNGNQLIFTQRL